MKKKLITALSLLAALCLHAQPQGEPAGGFGGFQMPEIKMEYSRKYADVDYAGDGEVYHRLDIYLPQEKKESYPVVVHIYGSAWYSNNSKGMADLGTICQALLDAGYAVVTPNHRSSSDAKFPAQIEDIKAVIRFIRGNAARYGFDTSFIAASGFSSGGHLASLAATSGGVAGLEGTVGDFLQLSSSVDAACDWSGPINLTRMDCAGPRNMAVSPEEDVIGLKFSPDNEAAFDRLSPIYYIDGDDPPVIIFHGVKDNVVPCCQATEFYETLDKAGVKTELTLEEEGGHGFNMYNEKNLRAMVDFLDAARSAKSARRPAAPRRSINPDGSVSFEIRADGASRVAADICNVKYPMKQGADGVWRVTSAPLAPGFHYYFLEVDGARFSDPLSESFYGCGTMASAVDIPEEGTDYMKVQDVPHGQVRLVNYFSSVTGEWRPLQVYTPASYEKGKGRYPVLYIQHGGGEDYRGWMQQGLTAEIMDNLIAEGKAEPMIVVAADSNLPGARGGYSWEGMQRFRDELVNCVIPFVEKNFRVKTGARNRAMCGLSMGGGQSFYIGLRTPEVFGNVGLFSSGIFGGIAGSGEMDFEKEIPGMLSDTDKFNRSHKVFYISCGEQDPRIGPTTRAVERMRSAGVEVIFESYPGDHEWQPWRKSLHSFAQKIFR